MNDRFSLFVCVSALIHLAVLLAFVRVSREREEELVRDELDGTARVVAHLDSLRGRELFEALGSPFMEEAVAESLWRADSVQLLAMLAQQRLAFDGRPGAASLLAGAGTNEEAAALCRMLGSGSIGPGYDSLFMHSEMLRRSLMKLVAGMSDVGPGLRMPDDGEWERILRHLAARVEALHGTGGEGSGTAARARLMKRLLDNERLMKLWREAAKFSLREVALERLREAVRRAALKCMQTCGTPGSRTKGMRPGEGGDRSRGEGRGSGTVLRGTGRGRRSEGDVVDAESHGRGGLFTGIGQTPGPGFEECLIRELRRGEGGGLGLMASLFETGELARVLAADIRETLAARMGRAEGGAGWLAELDLEGALSRALAPNEQTLADQRRAADFFATIARGLGDEVTSWLIDRPSERRLRADPDYYHDMARSYWDLIMRMGRSPNLVMPNLRAYAEAARAIRNRRLPEAATISIGSGITASAGPADYFVPRRIYAPSLTAPSDTPRPVRPLVEPPAFTHAWGGAVRVEKAVAVDGRLDEWDDALPYALWGGVQGRDGVPAYLEGHNRLLCKWDNRGLYFAYRIADARDNPVNQRLFWATDALELFIDPHNHKDERRVRGRSFQFWVWTRTHRRARAGRSVFHGPATWEPKLLKEQLVEVASVREGDGYACEVFMPATLLGEWFPFPGRTMGFNYSINNGENIYLRWVTNKGQNVSHHPNLWGDLLLMGSDATVRLYPDDIIVPGQNLRITITDPDMDLYARAHDKIWATVSCSTTTDHFPLALVETGRSTGVFTAEVGTIFAFRPKVKRRLSVRPGAAVRVYYLDQQRGGGEKQVPLEREIAVGRGVFTLSGLSVRRGR